MIRSTIKSSIRADLHTVWDVVTSLQDYSWRSDISSVEFSDEKHFKEVSNNGYVTSFTITVLEPLVQYSFTMDNENLSGEWTGFFKQTELGTEIQFIESIRLKKCRLYLFAWFYIRNQQKRYVSDLKRKCEQNG